MRNPDKCDDVIFMTAVVAFALAALLFFNGCASVPLPQGGSTEVLMLDLYGTVDSSEFTGIGVFSSAPVHDFKIQSKVDVNEMDIQTCHRFERYEDVIKTGWFHRNRGFEYIYNEAPGIEDNGYCVVRINAFTKQVGGAQAFALLLGHSPRFTLPAKNICNGAVGDAHGASVCQSANGLVERIRFDSQVITARSRPDGTLIPMMCEGKMLDGYTFEYKMPLGECVIEFAEVQKPNRRYVHLARGFNKTQYRGE
jgi:hypothetical protein